MKPLQHPPAPITCCPSCGMPTRTLLIVAHIQATVAAYYHIPPREMTAHRRDFWISHPRQIAMYLSYEMTPKSLPEIGKRFNRDHTTVLYAIRQVQARMLADDEVAEDVRRLRDLITKQRMEVGAKS